MVDLPLPVGPVTRIEPARLFAKLAQYRRQLELVEGFDLEGNHAEYAGRRPALVEQVAAKARNVLNAEGKIEFQVFFEPVLLRVGQNAVSELLGFRGAQRRNILQGLQFAMHADARRRVGGQVEVGSSRIDHPLQQFAESR